jgi:HicB family
VSNQIAACEERSVDLNIRVRPSLKKELEWRASSEGSSLSNWIERTLEAEVDSPAVIPPPTTAPLVPVPELLKPDRQRLAPPYLLQISALSALSWASIILVASILFALPTLVFITACAIGLLLSLLVLESLFRRPRQQAGSKFGDRTTPGV